MDTNQRDANEGATLSLEQCRRLPKVELHAHLNGSISSSTMQKLILRRMEKNRDTAGEIPKAWETAIATEERRTLDDCFTMFKIIHSIVDDEDAVAMVAHDVVCEFAADGVVYLELRSTPRANPNTGMTKQSYIDAVMHGVNKAVTECSFTISVRLLLSIDRCQGVSDATDTVQLAIAYSNSLRDHHSRVVGIDLSGDPNAGKITALIPVLVNAKEKGLNLSLHLSEIPDRNEETMLLLGTQPDRIGHGTFLHSDVGGTDELVDYITERRIPIEICLTSNLKTQTVSSYDLHHLRHWMAKDHPVVICTDDKGVFSTSLSEEYFIASQVFNITPSAIKMLSLKAVDYIFEEETFKSTLKLKWQ